MAEEGAASLATWLQVIASIASVVVALVALVIARRAARDQRVSRDYQADRAAADDFAAELDALVKDIPRGRFSIQLIRLRFAEALARYIGRVSHSRHQRERGEFRHYLATIEADASHHLPAAMQGEMRAGFDYASSYDRIILVARDWAYPERRRAILADYLASLPATPSDPSENRELQVERLLLATDPSSSRVAQMWRVGRVARRQFVDDLRNRRVKQRTRDWLRSRRIQRREIAAYKAALREKREPGMPPTAEA